MTRWYSVACWCSRRSRLLAWVAAATWGYLTGLYVTGHALGAGDVLLAAEAVTVTFAAGVGLGMRLMARVVGPPAQRAYDAARRARTATEAVAETSRRLSELFGPRPDQ